MVWAEQRQPLTISMGFIQLVEEVREAQQVGGGQEGDREGGVADARRLERPRKHRLLAE